jgi:hypothetical protein
MRVAYFRVSEGGNPEAGVVPEMMLHKNLLPPTFEPNRKHSIGKVGMYHFDLSSTVMAGTLLDDVVEIRNLDFGLCCSTNRIDCHRSCNEPHSGLSTH